VDLRIVGPLATAVERAAVDGVLGPPESGWHGGVRDARLEGHVAYGGYAARERRHLLLPALHAVNDRVGWISQGALGYICQRLTVPPADAYGVASFYALFSLTPRPPVVAQVCDDVACLVQGAEAVCAELERTLGPAGTPTAAGRATWQRSPCLGLCERAPAAMVRVAGEEPRETVLAPADAAAVADELATRGGPTGDRAPSAPPIPQAGDPSLRLLRRAGRVDPESLDEYRAHGGYEALRRSLEIGPEAVIREVIDSKLLGRGGAAFPAGRKWEAVAHAAARPHELVCNADESEPGTFKDRLLMEADPFAVVEAMTIAGIATGCERGFLYIRGEYPLALERLERAIAQARSHGFLGDDVMGHGVRFEIEIRRGAGAYICGEETALFNSIEGRRGEPRNKPPFPTQAGLFGRPTVVNNVETLVNVLDIVREGAAAYVAIGTAGSTGTKLFAVSGQVERPGLYEVPFGTPLRSLLDLAGGVAGGRQLGAILLGGAAGTFVTEAQLDTPLAFETLRAVGATLGSGVVLVFDESADLAAVVARIARFFRDESCGQCVPCRVGTVRQEEALARYVRARGDGPGGEVRMEIEAELIGEIGRVMRDASICGLGQTASNAVESAIAAGLLETPA